MEGGGDLKCPVEESRSPLCRFGWQWQLGAVAITAAWVNLVSNVRKFPFLGIYVVMITDVLLTFMKVAVIVILLVEGFALGFYCLLAEQV